MGPGALLEIRGVLTLGGHGLHSGRPDNLELSYSVRRVPYLGIGEGLDAIWQPILEAPLHLDTLTVLAAPALRLLSVSPLFLWPLFLLSTRICASKSTVRAAAQRHGEVTMQPHRFSSACFPVLANQIAERGSRFLLAAGWLLVHPVAASQIPASGGPAVDAGPATVECRLPTGAAPDSLAGWVTRIESATYVFGPDGSARNRQQGMTLAARPGGLHVDGDLQLRAVAVNGVPLPESRPLVHEQRVEYRHAAAEAGLAVVEWYENRREGVEQGFTIEAPVSDGWPRGFVDLTVRASGCRAIEVGADGLSARLTGARGRNYSYGGTRAADAAGQSLPVVLRAEPPDVVHIVCDARDARFPVVIDPLLVGMERTLTASDKAGYDYFGNSVSVAGDVAVAGAPYADLGALSGAGAAYVFERNAGGVNAWGQVAKLTASDKASTNSFGMSVGVDGDVAVVGAPWANLGALAEAGAAYVFERNAGGINAWGQVAKLTASDKQEYGEFGYAVSVAGDVVFIGALNAADSGIPGVGVVYVYERNAGGTNAWKQVARLTASDKGIYASFGYSVSVKGSVALVGAANTDAGGVADAGAAYVFERNAGGTNAWKEVARLTAVDKAGSAYLGYSASLDGNVALVGAFGVASGGAANAGAAYVFERNAGGSNAWGQVAKLTAPDPAADAMFGYGVSVAGDVALVGAIGVSSDGTPAAGATYVFERNAGGTGAWGRVARIASPNKTMQGAFGWSVSVAGDLAMVGACRECPGGLISAGSAYVIPLDREGWTQGAKIMAGDSNGSDSFGGAVCAGRDVAVVGASYANTPGVASAGAAYILGRQPAGDGAWRQVAKLVAADRAIGDCFGSGVGVDGDVVAVGACNAYPGGVSQAGAAYVFERHAGGTNAWGQVAKLTAPDKAAGDFFGQSVDVAGDVVLVGAFYSDPGGVRDAGAAYLYERNAGGTNAWGAVAKLTASDKAEYDCFGYSVSADGDVALVGAWASNPGGLGNAGAAYVYERNRGGTNRWGQAAKLTASDRAELDSFGRSVCVAGDVALVGANSASHGGVAYAGAAYVFERNAGGINAWGQVAKLTAPDRGEWAGMGVAVCVAGDVALVGAPYADAEGLTDAGVTYVFHRNAGGTNAWGLVARLTAADRAANAWFGQSASVAGNGAFVGAPWASGGGAIYAIDGYLYEPLAIRSCCREAGACALSFPSHPASLYSLEWRTNLCGAAWQPAPCLTNLPGDVTRSLTVRHTNDCPVIFYRLTRNMP